MMLEIKNLTAGYIEDSPVLKGIDLTVGDNEVVGIVGQNGSGKSTLAKAIMNLVPSVSGEILFNRQNILGKKTHELLDIGIGYFPQGGRIFPNLTVKENLEFVCRKMKKAERNEWFSEIAEIFILFKSDRMNLKASYLSGGEQHQLALAMVLIQKPIFLLLDEPSAGLSPKNCEKIFSTLKKVRNILEIGVILIEQNISFVYEFSNKVIIFKSGIAQNVSTKLEEIEKEYF